MGDLKLAVAGFGVRGKHWVSAISSDLIGELAGVIEPNLERVPENLHVFSSVAEGISSKIDGLIVASPPSTHREIVEIALNEGIPTLCEKPLSPAMSEAKALAEISRRTGTPLLVGMNFRFVAASRGLRELVSTNEFGAPMFADFTYIRNRDGRRPDLNDYPLIMDQPMLIDQSIHHLDLMRYAYGREVVRVSAVTWNPATSVYTDDSCVGAVLEFEDGLIVNYLGTWTSGTNRFDFRWRTDFVDGTVIQNEQFGALAASRRDPSLSFGSKLHDIEVEPPQVIGWGPSEPFVDDTNALLSHFIDVILGKDAPGPTAHDHLLTLNLIDSIIEASREGVRVEVLDRAESLGLVVPH